MVYPIFQPHDVSLRRQSDPENVLGGTFCVAFGMRSYSPELGRWINRDPIGEKGGRNVYAFLANCTILKYDLLGFLGLSDSLRSKCGVLVMITHGRENGPGNFLPGFDIKKNVEFKRLILISCHSGRWLPGWTTTNDPQKVVILSPLSKGPIGTTPFEEGIPEKDLPDGNNGRKVNREGFRAYIDEVFSQALSTSRDICKLKKKDKKKRCCSDVKIVFEVAPDATTEWSYSKSAVNDRGLSNGARVIFDCDDGLKTVGGDFVKYLKGLEGGSK